MPREKASRKYLITINNPLDHGFSHEQIKKILASFKLEYWCMCDEIGLEEKTPHTHIYMVSKNPIMFSTVHRRFYGAHIDRVKGTSQQTRNYILKEGDYADSEKKETNLPETFEEWGFMPIERQGSAKMSDEVLQMIKDGCSDVEIVNCFPSYMTKLPYIDQMRQKLIGEKYANVFRKLEVQYIYGESGVGKTRGIYDKYGYKNVYRVSDYNHPFDGYNGQDVLLLDEFRSNIPISLMLELLDGYPFELPSRYSNKQACYTKVVIISNVSLNMQYPNIQETEPETWKALLRRINSITRFERNKGQYPFAQIDEVVSIDEPKENYII